MRNFVLCKAHETIFRKEKEICKACGAYGEKRILCRVLVEKPAGKRPHGKTSTESTE
jgi:rRNA maturation endonuclease Nob1